MSNSTKDIKAICAKIHDAIFMKYDTYKRLLDELNTPPSNDMFLVGGYAGTLNGIQVIVYDDTNKEDLLNEYAMNFYQQRGREPSILLVK